MEFEKLVQEIRIRFVRFPAWEVQVFENQSPRVYVMKSVKSVLKLQKIPLKVRFEFDRISAENCIEILDEFWIELPNTQRAA